MALGNQIRKYRQQAQLSQETLAELVGVSRQAVSKWESNRSAPGTEHLLRLAEIFSVTVEELIREPQVETGSETAKEVLHLLRADSAARRADRLCRLRRNLGMTAVVLLGYGAVYVLGRLMGGGKDTHSIVAWLQNTSLRENTYLFGWLLRCHLFSAALLLSAAALFGRFRFALTTLAGFALALPLGEYLGRNPAGKPWGQNHYGWLIWAGIMLLSLIFGIVAEKMKRKAIPLRSRASLIWLGGFILGIAAVLLAVMGEIWFFGYIPPTE